MKNQIVLPEMTVLPADPNPGKEIKWMCCEYLGVEVLTAPPGLTHEQVLALKGFPEGFKPEPITTQGDLQEGSVVLIPGMMGGLGVYQVQRMEDGALCGRSGDMMASLEFGGDGRNCWVCCGTANLAALQKLELYGG